MFDLKVQLKSNVDFSFLAFLMHEVTAFFGNAGNCVVAFPKNA